MIHCPRGIEIFIVLLPFRYPRYVYTMRVARHPFIFYLRVAMNHFATQVCDKRLKVTILGLDVNHARQQIDHHSESLSLCYLGMSPEIQYLSKKGEKCSLLLHLNGSF